GRRRPTWTSRPRSRSTTWSSPSCGVDRSWPEAAARDALHDPARAARPPVRPGRRRDVPAAAATPRDGRALDAPLAATGRRRGGERAVAEAPPKPPVPAPAAPRRDPRP